VQFSIFPAALIALSFACPANADDSKPATRNDKTKSAEQDELATLVEAVNGKKSPTPIHQLTGAIDRKLNDKATAEAMAKRMLDRKAEFKVGPAAEKRLEAIVADKKSVPAAQLLLQCVRSKLISGATGKGGVAIGQVVVEDGKLDTEWVLAQMPILPGGYFAGEVGDVGKPLHFRAAGYEDVAVPIGGKAGDVVDVGTVTMKPIAADKMATLKGKIALDIVDRGPATASVSLMVPPPNTAGNYYSPRRAWPKPTPVKIEADGSFLVAGLTPGDYYLQVQAKDHGNEVKRIKAAPGKVADQGLIKLKTTDLGHYIGKAAPKTGDLPWEKDFAAASAKAESKKRPMMVMMTATWCGPCKALEQNVLNDAWVKHFLADYVIVKAYEDKDVEKKYGMNGYPTLVFTDSSGKEMHRTSGNQPSTKFLGNVVKASKKLSIKLPAELQTLVDKKVVAGD
jgi:thiol-disulfide isomerase/thioredoxin